LDRAIDDVAGRHPLEQADLIVGRAIGVDEDQVGRQIAVEDGGVPGEHGGEAGVLGTANLFLSDHAASPKRGKVFSGPVGASKTRRAMRSRWNGASPQAKVRAKARLT